MTSTSTASSLSVEIGVRRKHAIDFLVAAGQQQAKRVRLMSDTSLISDTNDSSVPLSSSPPLFEFAPGALLPPPPPPPASSYEAALSLASLPMGQPILGPAAAYLPTPIPYDAFRAPTNTIIQTGTTTNNAPIYSIPRESVPVDHTSFTTATFDASPPDSSFDALLPSSTAPPPRTTITCSECKIEFPDGNALTEHARNEHPAKPYPCLTCGRCFGEKGNKNKHHRTVHLKQRKHSCGTCGRSFAFMDGLNRHIAMVHLDRRPFECTFCQCPGGRHDENVPCTHICGMRFKQKSHRRRHVRSVHQATR